MIQTKVVTVLQFVNVSVSLIDQTMCLIYNVSAIYIHMSSYKCII